MRSESEIRWVRAKNNVNQVTKASDWHVIIPGMGSLNLPPGTACSTGLVGSLQFAQHSALKSLDGRVHEECRAIAEAWIESLDPTPGPLAQPDDGPALAGPNNRYSEGPRAEA